MNENETNPRPADAGAGDSRTERVESEQPTLAQPPVAPQSAAPQSAAPHTPAAQFPASGPPQSAQPQSAQPHSPWAEPAWQNTAQQSAAPADPAAAQQYPYGHPHQGYQAPQGWAGYQQPHSGYPDYGQQPAYAAGWQHGGTQTQIGPDGAPVWGPPAGEPRRPGRGRKALLTGAAALLIALGGGAAGAAATMAMDDDNGTRSVPTGNSSVTRVVDRSSLAQIAAAVQDSVVSITTGNGEGSGVVISTDGYIVTNNHVVSTAQGGKVNIIFADGTKATADVVGTDPRTDLAVVKATGVSDLKSATFGDSAQMQVGDTVLALGSPLGLEGSVTAGIISAKDRAIQSGGEEEQQPQSPFGGGQQQQTAPTTMTGLLQTDAPINPGNSGGALVNTNGEVIGINSAIATSGQGSGNIGLGFAIPSNKAKDVADALMSGKKVSHPALGVSVTTGENGGALVSTVTANSAAAKAGLQQGDVVTKVDGKAVDDSDDLVAAVQAGSVGQKMTLTFTRNGSEKTVDVTLLEAQ